MSEKYAVPEEKQLVVYTSHKDEVYLPIIREFENKTGICVEIHTGGTAEIFKAVKEAGDKCDCDVLFGGGVESYEAAKDILLPYAVDCKDMLDPRFVSDGDFWTAFTELPLVIIYNSKLLAKEDAPSSWKDLLRGDLKGRIAFADLYNSGTSYTILSTVSQVNGTDAKETVSLVYDQIEGKVLGSSGDIITNVSNGTFLCGVTLEETAMKAIAAGYDIAMVYPEEGTSAVPDGCAIVKNAAHSYNAGCFIDFVAGYEIQRYATDKFMRRPVRTDVELPGKFADIKLMDFDIEKSALEESGFFEAWDECLEGK